MTGEENNEYTYFCHVSIKVKVKEKEHFSVLCD
jgi:hypothetical protein